MDSKNDEAVSCILCGADDAETISRKPGVTVVLCRKCGLGYLNPRWSKQRYAEFYAAEYDAQYRSEPIATPGQLRGDSVAARLAQFGVVTTGDLAALSVLDIGSGDGGDLSDMKVLLPRARMFAIEPSPYCRKRLIDRGDVTVLGSYVEAPGWSDSDVLFDVVIMRHVLEHFFDPLVVLQHVARVLAPHGSLYLAVPNCLKPQSPMEGHWFRAAHTYYFNVHSLSKMAGLAGLEIVQCETPAHELVILARRAAVATAQVPVSSEHYGEQRKVFAAAIARDRTLPRRIKRALRSCIKGIGGWAPTK